MKDIQDVLYEKLNYNKYGNLLLHYAAILIYISVGHGILDLLPMPTAIDVVLRYTSRLVYFGYIAGLIGCFSKKDFLPIMLIFLLKALTSVIYCFNWITLTNILNILVYGSVGYFAFTFFMKGRTNTTAVNTGDKKFCPNCGQEVSAEVSFCSNCGSKF